MIRAIIIMTLLVAGLTGMHLDDRVGPADSRDATAGPVVIAHRGASGYLPEHTLAAYERAMEAGADFIEPDLVMTRDGHLIARHESRLDDTTDIARRPELAHLKTTKNIDGRTSTGWFSEDLTLAQIKTLRARERLPELRVLGAEKDGLYTIPTLREILDLLAGWRSEHGREVGIYPETKHPSHFQSLGLPMEQALVSQLHGAGFDSASSPAYIQSFEVSNLRELNRITNLRLVQLMEADGGPWDQVADGNATASYQQMATEAGLKVVAEYADAVGPDKTLILPRDANDNLDLSNSTEFVARAHQAGLAVHPYTFRAENYFLPRNMQSNGGSSEHGNLRAEIALFLELGIDGFFVDYPDIGVDAVSRFTGQP